MAEQNKQVMQAPAPWELSGEAWMVLLKAQDLPMPGQRVGSLWPGIAIYVDYKSSPVGPYEELLLIPGRQAFPQGPRMTISTIYVSTWESVINGRKNWGIPKQLARFERTRLGPRHESLKVYRNEQMICSWELSHQAWHIPFGSGLLPGGLRTLAQAWEGQGFEIKISAGGQMAFGKLHAAWGDETHWFAGDQSRALLCCKYDNFRLSFPVPKLFPAPDGLSLSEKHLLANG
ncbi:MAG: hypothetical protein ACOH5I_01440 [Oligoflexus sp.]